MGFLLVTLGYQPYCPASCSCSNQVAMSAPSANPAGVLPIADASSVPVPTQSDQGTSEVHGPIVRPADLRTGIASSPLWSRPQSPRKTVSGSRRNDPTGTYGPLLWQQNNLANVAVVHHHGVPLETTGISRLLTLSGSHRCATCQCQQLFSKLRWSSTT